MSGSVFQTTGMGGIWEIVGHVRLFTFSQGGGYERIEDNGGYCDTTINIDTY